MAENMGMKKDRREKWAIKKVRKRECKLLKIENMRMK